MMEGAGGAGVGNSYWSVDTLPAPASWGWTNVAYQTHAYALDGGTGAEGTAQWQVTQLSYNSVPILVGEFNLGDRELFGVQLWDDNNLNWTSWTAKARQWTDSNWGIYEVTQWPASPNLQTDSASQILSDYATVTTAGHFGLQTTLGGVFGSPLLANDRYTTTPGAALYVAPAQGVLANDTDPNLGQAGITLHAYQADAPAHGTLTLYDDGSFYYVPAAGFTGTDTFRYFVWDNRNDSANIATVSLTVVPLPAGWTSADIGTPGIAGGAAFNIGDATWTVRGGGADIYGTGDQFQYAMQDFAADGALVARVTSVENTNASAKAGVMMRSSTAAGSRYAFVFATPSGVYFQTRTATGAAATTVGSAAVTAPVWLKLTRSGTTYIGWWSSDGATWTALGTQTTLTMSATPKAGLAVTAHDDAKLSTGAFASVALSTFTGFTAWQYQNFTAAQLGTAAISALLADANNDGVKNLLAYAAGLTPWTLATTANGGRPLATSTGGHPALTFTRSTAATDLTLTVQAADIPAGPWTDLARSTGGAAFTVLAAGATATETGAGVIRTVEVRDLYLTSDPAHPRRFLRVHALH